MSQHYVDKLDIALNRCTMGAMTPVRAAGASGAARGRRTSRPSGDEREAAILRTAEQLLTQQGFSQISIDDLARGAGISRPTFYFYFPSKNAVLLTLLDRVVDEANAATGRGRHPCRARPRSRARGPARPGSGDRAGLDERTGDLRHAGERRPRRRRARPRRRAPRHLAHEHLPDDRSAPGLTRPSEPRALRARPRSHSLVALCHISDRRNGPT